MYSRVSIAAVAATLVAALAAPSPGAAEFHMDAAAEKADYANAAARVAARSAGGSRAENKRARNVILFIGDGMGISTITAARILEGQQKGGPGEDNRLSFENFDYTALVKTFSADQQTSDSAPTATAMVTGYKANDGALSVAPMLGERDADLAHVTAQSLQTILEQAEARGLATGIVSTARITHATPAANFAHTPNRDWETAGQLPPGATLPDIAAQLVARQKTGDGIEVVLGGGRQMLLPRGTADPEYPAVRGARNDGRNLVDEWVAAQPASSYVWRTQEFAALDPDKVHHLLGLFEPSHMQYEADRAADGAGEPALRDMTRKAIQMLAHNRKGYYLMVEGGRIDHAHHAGNAYRALTDTIAFSDAVRTAMEMTDPRDTLILVTADHSHVLTISGYPARGNPILGLVRAPGTTAPSTDANGQPYTTLSYANGPGYGLLEHGGDAAASRPVLAGRGHDLTSIDTTAEGFHQESLVAMRGETHGGEDVALFARGPRARLARGSIEQSEIYHIMRAALGF